MGNSSEIGCDSPINGIIHTYEQGVVSIFAGGIAFNEGSLRNLPFYLFFVSSGILIENRKSV